MKPGTCAFCEEPLPEGRLEGYCDDTCQDLHSRTVKSKPARHYGPMRNARRPVLSKDEQKILKEEPRMKPLPEEESS